MKTIIRRSLILLPLLASIALAKPEIINQNIIKKDAADKINQLSQELYSKTGVSIATHLIEQADGGILEYEKNISSSLKTPFALVVLSAKEQKVDMVVSDDLKSIVDKNNILNTYIIPLLAVQDKNSLEAKYSAAVLNGVAEIADEVAKSKNIELESSIGSGSRDFMQALRIFFYGTIIFAVGFYIYGAFKRRGSKA
ncbi:MAG TPA: TPM domain-containing protein [Campylobacterales bacterium]|nr:TPM domain-containing protein [Campylobacterales bacterium]